MSNIKNLVSRKDEKQKQKEEYLIKSQSQLPDDDNHSIWDSIRCLSLIFEFIEQKNRFKYRVLSRNFKLAINKSVRYIYFDQIPLTLANQRILLYQFREIEFIRFRKLYKKNRIRTILHRKESTKMKIVKGIQFTKYDQIIQVLQLYPNLRSLELVFKQPRQNEQLDLGLLEDPSQILNSHLKELELHFNGVRDFRIQEILKDKLNSLIIRTHSLDAQEFNTLQALGLIIENFHVILHGDGYVSESLLIFLLSLTQLKNLILEDFYDAQLTFIHHLHNLDHLTLKNSYMIKGLLFNQPIKKLTIDSYQLTGKHIKYLLRKLEFIDILDLRRTQNAWISLFIEDGQQFQLYDKTKTVLVSMDHANALRAQEFFKQYNIQIKNYSCC
ncbi:hypothetical protein pb186bvf_001232 [Paramecium bursaria]